MPDTKYLIVGGSHAGLTALHAIRMLDGDAPVALMTRDDRLPYSPTVLPYIVSGHSRPDNVALRDDAYFERNKVHFVRRAEVAAVAPARNTVELATGEAWRYEKLLLATGAVPAIPPVEGLAEVPYHVLRTMDDALGLRRAAEGAGSAVVLGAGLVGMHAAENLARAGLTVTVVEREPQVLPGYFATEAAAMIEHTFVEHGVRMVLGDTVTAARRKGSNGAGGAVLTLASGAEIAADMLLVATGVVPAMGYLEGAGLATDRGILVDETMATSADGVWAAGDVAQAGDFYGSEKIVNAIVPDAVEQGRIAGMAMIDDPAIKPYPGGVPLNSYTFFGRPAISVGTGAGGNGAEDFEVAQVHDDERGRYRRIVLRDDRLVGISAIGEPVDAGIMWQLILRRVDLAPVKQAFLAKPLETGRALMSKLWR